jgi:hypothetical protein
VSKPRRGLGFVTGLAALLNRRGTWAWRPCSTGGGLAALLNRRGAPVWRPCPTGGGAGLAALLDRRRAASVVPTGQGRSNPKV